MSNPAKPAQKKYQPYALLLQKTALSLRQTQAQFQMVPLLLL